MFYPVSGRYRLEEIDVPIGPGEVVGEIGLVTPDNKRTQTFRCEEDGELLVIGYNQVKQLYFQNPKFGFFFLKLITQRLLANHRNMQERLEQALAAAR
ncbi:MAG: cyclic nucleotide-binding domain-containing protein [Pseudorhodoplanes sp.]|nr:cyclic nucleotide-binding domain-containing protein [Pseudorhodoplanes sp.]